MNTNATDRTDWADVLRPLPEGWRLLRLKNVAEITNSNVDKNSSEDETPVRLCNYTDVYYREFITDDLDLMRATATDDEIERFSLRPGDVVITKDSEMWNDIAIPAVVAEELDGVVCGYHLTVLRPHAGLMDGRFLLRSLQAGGVREQFHVSAKGITRYGLSQHHIQDVVVPVPPADDQRRLAAFLDRKTAQIDTLIQKKQALIDLLREQRTALINRAVTKGLDPDVPMRDSGIEWLGEVPEHWAMLKLKYVAEFYGGGTPSKANADFWSGDIPWVSPKDMKQEYILDAEDHITAEAVEASATRLIEPGSVLMVVRSGILKHTLPVAINRRVVALNQDMKAIICSGSVHPEYLRHLIKGHEANLLLEWRKQGATVESIEQELLANSDIPVPPLEEQERIVGFLREHGKKFRGLVRKERDTIRLLREVRTSLISEVVTGKIDVRHLGDVTDEDAGEDIAA